MQRGCGSKGAHLRDPPRVPRLVEAHPLGCGVKVHVDLRHELDAEHACHVASARHAVLGEIADERVQGPQALAGDGHVCQGHDATGGQAPCRVALLRDKPSSRPWEGAHCQ